MGKLECLPPWEVNYGMNNAEKGKRRKKRKKTMTKESHKESGN